MKTLIVIQRLGVVVVVVVVRLCVGGVGGLFSLIW